MNLDNQKNPDEIICDKLTNITPINFYFDLTPIEFITGIITEKEILSPPEIIEIIKNLKVHKSLI